MAAPTGATRVCAVVGSPIRHSLSPALHNAAFEAAGLDWTYVAFEVGSGSGRAAVEAARTLGLAGLSVTMPLKAEVAEAVDDLSPTAAALRSVNCVVADGDRLIGHSTDGAGFLASLEGVDVAGRRCLVLGAGGAARAVIHALAGVGASVSVWNRTAERAAAAAALAGPSGTVVETPSPRGFDVIVNATSAGMAGTDGADTLLVDPALLSPGAAVVDLVYHPQRTPVLTAAAARGVTVVGGLGMLVHQAAEAFRLWTGQPPPIDVMMAAAQRVLRGS